MAAAGDHRDEHRDGLRIGELARHTATSTRSLRYYERRGLITADREHNGYRRHAPDGRCRPNRRRRTQPMSRPAAWIDITATDAEKARAFYGGLFGWELQFPAGPDYGVVTAGPGRLPGGIGQAGATGPHPAGVVTYLTVDDVDDSLTRAQELGGTVAVAPWTIPGLGTMAVILDLDGNRIGLWTPAAEG